MNNFAKPLIVISSCIEHHPCRWNGVMIASPFVERLKKYVEFKPICPEVEVGLGVPRKTIRMVHSKNKLLLLQNETGLDITTKMNSFAANYLDSLAEVDGFILKDRSPSCGYKDVKLYPSIGKVSAISGKETGFFGREVIKRFGHLAIENEGRLNNYIIREHFLTKLFTLSSFRKISAEKSMKAIVDFHSRNKYLLMAYNQTVMRQMGKIVANHEKNNADVIFNEYSNYLGRALSKAPRYTSSINVLMHGLGYFSKVLSAKEKAYFLDALDQYRMNKVPLSVCQSLLQSWIIRFDELYLMEQTFFKPYPEGLIDITDSGKGRA